MIYILDNLSAILFATGLGYAVSAVWYMALTGSWQRATGRDQVRPRTLSIVAIVLQFWIACILAGAIILAPPEAGAWTMAIGSAFVIWIGFVAPTTAMNNIYAGRSFALTAIEAGHWLAVFLVQVVTMQAWGLVAPATA